MNIIIPDMPGNIPQNYARQAGLSASPIKSPLRLPSEVVGRVVNIIIPDMPGNIPQNYARQAGLSASQ